MLSYEAARAEVMEVIRARRCAPPPATETVEFASDPPKVLGRILAENIPADRNYPPFNRANTIGMIEDAQVEGETVVVGKPARPSAHFVLEGQETRVGESVIKKGTRLGYAELAMAVQVGRSRLLVTKKPRVAILSTGDEIVPVDQPPKKFHFRNTNTISPAAQGGLAGGARLIL